MKIQMEFGENMNMMKMVMKYIMKIQMERLWMTDKNVKCIVRKKLEKYQ
jgi:hypothetical protein